PKVELTRVRAPNLGSVGSAVAHGAALTANAAGQLGSTGAAIAQTVLSNQESEESNFQQLRFYTPTCQVSGNILESLMNEHKKNPHVIYF
ncbi:hypothetical protein MTO96_050848, partial [Rhipicephalus appendiculatus]